MSESPDFALLYDELHRIARRELHRAGGGELTLGATTLLHEAYLSLADRTSLSFPDRNHFMAYASRAMRGLVIDYARRRQALKRGGAFEITSLSTQASESLGAAAESVELERLGEAIDELAALEPGLAQVVDLKYFCGFSFAEIGAMRGVCERTVQRDWDKARIFLHRSLQD